MESVCLVVGSVCVCEWWCVRVCSRPSVVVVCVCDGMCVCDGVVCDVFRCRCV